MENNTHSEFAAMPMIGDKARVFYSLNDKKSLRALKNARFSCQ